MTSALSFADVVKDYRGLRPLRVAALDVAPGERVAIAGLDVAAAETFINLATGAGLPDQGTVTVMGQATDAITESDDWLASLDRFGIVSHRAVLLDESTVAQNIAMSFTLSIDPVPADVRAKVESIAEIVELPPSLLDTALSQAGGAARVRTHLARALALDPAILILEHATLGVPRDDVAGLARSLVRATDARHLAVIALTDDDVLAKGMAGRRLRLDAATGRLKAPSIFSR